MIALSLGPASRRGLPRLLMALTAVLAVLWTIQIYPRAEALFLPVNLLTAQMSAVILAWIGLPVMRDSTQLAHAGGFSCEIDYTCTALIPVLLLSAGIFAWRARWHWRLRGVLVGSLLLVGVNQLRIVSLVWLGVHSPAWFDAAHLWFWPLVLIVITAGYGYAWARLSK